MNKNKINKIVIFPIVFFGLLFFAKASLAATYYIDATGGNDGNAGTSEGAAWQTINKVNTSSFSPGDSILFKKGETWRERLEVPSSGSAGNPITFGAYGTGVAPIISGYLAKNNTGDWTADGGQANTWYASSVALDIGHIKSGSTILPTKRSAKASCVAQGEFYSDTAAQRTYIYSTSNPATYYSGDLGLAQRYASSGLLHIAAKDYITVQDINVTGSGGHGVMAESAASEIILQRLNVSYVGGAYLYDAVRYGNGVEYYDGASNLVLQDSTISQAFDEGFTSQGQTETTRLNHQFLRNTVDKCGRGAAFSINSGTPTITDPIIEGNTFTDLGLGWATPAGGSNGQGIGAMLNAATTTGGIFRNNIIRNTASGADPIGQGITIYGGGWTIDRNWIENTHNSGIRALGDPTLNINYNTIIDPNNKPCMFFSGDDSNANTTNIYNNICVATDSSNTQLILLGADGGYAVTNHNFKNNIVMNTGTNTAALVEVSTSSTATLDYNLYYRNSAGNLVKWSNGTTYTQAQWANYKSASSQDSHSPTPTDPLFVSTVTPDFHLQSSSPALNAGVDLSLSYDHEGNVPGNPPEIGAYEYVNAGAWYVNQTLGIDTQNGTQAAPWKTIAKVNATTFNPGNSIYFKKGETWLEQLTVPSSGSAGSPITFGAYGSGNNPIIDGAATRTRTILIDGKNYVTVQNIKCINSASSGQGSVYVNNSGYIILDGLVLNNNAGFAGIYAEGSGAGKQIINSTISNTSHADADRGAGIMLDGAAGGHTISGNTIHNNSANGIKLNMYVATSANTISNNTVYGNGGSGISVNVDSASNIIEYNTVYANGTTLADRYNIDLFKVGNDNIVRYNTVHDSNYISLDAGGIRFDANPGSVFGTGNEIYGNLIYNERAGIQILSADNAAAYNNSIYNSGVTGIWLHGADADNNTVKNNIIHTAGTNLIYNQDATNSVINYNLYYPDTGTKFNWNDSSYNFSSWKTNSSQDANSPTPADPLFVSASDFHLQAGSPAINTATDVSLTSDYEGNTVPYGGTPDIGAYEYQSGIDTTPNDFVFTDITGATRSTQYTSNTITVAGIDADADITITGGTYSINGGAYTSGAGTVSLSDDVSVRVTSSGSYSTAVNATLTIGGISDTYTVTTLAPDSTPPVLSAGAPSGTLAVGTTSTNLTLTTDENATCRYSTTSGIAYGSMANTFTTTGSTSHSQNITGLTDGNSYSYYVKCSDSSSNANSSDYTLSFSVAATSDSTPPVLSAGAPSGALAAGTTSTNLTLTTDENATCRFGTVQDTAYDSMSLTFTTTGGISHAYSLTGLANGTDYIYYVRCSDGTDNFTSSDYIVTFGVASPPSQDDDDDSPSKKKETPKRGISQSKKSISQGQVLIQRGKKFSKSSKVALYFSRPNGSYYPPMIITTTKTGSFSVAYRVTKPKGTYKWYAVNLKTGWKSKTVSYEVR